LSLPLLRALHRRHGPLALLHFDAHLDTWDTYFGAAYTHGTPFRRAWEEGLLLQDQAVHVGIRGPLFSPEDLVDDARFGFEIVGAMEVLEVGAREVAGRIRTRLADAPVYVSIDIDVLDPAFAPGTGTPEAGGMTSRELLGILRGLAGVHLVAADIVEVAPPYDHAEITAVAASHVAYELLALFARA
jgi:agmatinase